MPSHISHSLFAQKLMSSLGIKNLGSDAENALHLGAQGPDIFYHNQRSSPSGLLIGSVLHRKGIASVSARMLEKCLLDDKSATSAEAVYVLSFISHAVLDRVFHPYINYFSGWVDGSEEAEAYRNCHPFFERIVDTALMLAIEPDAADFSAASSQPLNGYGFADRFDAGPSMPAGIKSNLEYGLRKCYRRMAVDQELSQRIENAYMDSRGFYHYCEHPADTSVSLKFAALLHPRFLPADIDFTNSGASAWYDPCDGENERTESVFELFDLALELAIKICGPVYKILDGSDPPGDYPGLPADLGDHGLRSDIKGTDPDIPCTLFHSNPLPLQQILQTISTGRYPDSWLTADQVLSPGS